MTRSVLHVLGVLDRGGAELTSLDLCRRIPPTELHQEFVTLTGRAGSLAPQFEAAGAVVRPLALRPLPRFVVQWVWLLRRQRPDVVVSHVSLPSGLLLVLARLAGVPRRLARFHSEGDDRGASWRRRGLRAVLRGLLLLGATEVLPVTAAAGDFAAGSSRRLRSRMTVLPNGVDVDRFHPGQGTRPEGLVVLHVGRAAPEKNRVFLLDLLRCLPEAELVLVGPGGTADLPDLPPKVILRGEHDDVAADLAAASVLALPSLREGLPSVVLEALSAGCPVVATDLPGLRALSAELVGLTTLPLSAGAAVWATAVREAAAQDRTAIREALVASPYALERVIGRWTAVLGTT